MEARLNSFFNAAIAIAALAFGAPSIAADVTSFYVGACQRRTGFLLDVDRMHATLLLLDGEVLSIPRYEIIYVATYPLDVVPVRRTNDAGKVPPLRVRTRQQDGRLVDLVDGWPIDFTEDRISFLSTSGSGSVVDRDSIWELERLPVAGPMEFKGAATGRYEFAHPYAFAQCPTEPDKSGGARKLVSYPQQILSDPVAIKRELDRLMKGHEVVESYLKRQQFYAVPQLYGNESSLGFWFMAGTRYGASQNRTNNFAPIVEDQRSFGPFSYQQIVRTGAAPVPFSVHEETQTQAYYRFKADYFHASAMVDPGLFLVGTKYQWQAADLKIPDFGVFESAIVEFGFDYGSMALGLTAAGAANVAAQTPFGFAREVVNLPRFNLMYQSHRASADLQIGSGAKGAHSLSFWRINGSWRFNPRLVAQASLISKTYKHDNEDGAAFDFRADSRTAAVYAHWKLDKRVTASAFVALEQVARSYSSGTSAGGASDDASYPKGGLGGSFSF